MFEADDEDRSSGGSWYNAFEQYLAGGLIAALFLVLNLQIFTRYVLGSPLSWTEEVARYLFVWMVFIGSAAAMLDRSHVAIEMFVDALEPRARLLIRLVSDVLCLSFLVIFAYWSSKTLSRVWAIPSSALELPSGILYSSVPISVSLMIVRLVQRSARDVRENRGRASR